MRLRLFQIGSDPEWAFAQMDDWGNTNLLPATEVITRSRTLGLTTFIGVDGHASTAEMRPPPARNVKRHLYNVAFGLLAVQEHLQRTPRLRSVRIVARPAFHGEPLGGHLHATFWVYDPDLCVLAYDYNRTPVTNDSQVSYTSYVSTLPGVPVDARLRALFARISDRINDGKAMSPYLFALVEGYLLEPFELWVQPWYERYERNSAYGVSEQVRYSYLHPPATDNVGDGWLWLHYEYRVPSTWLAHPWLAYTYMALFKFTLLNWNSVMQFAVRSETRLLATSRRQEPSSEKYFGVFLRRWREVSALPGLRVTPDLRDLDPAIQFLQKHRTRIFDRESIDIRAWAHVVGQAEGETTTATAS